VKRLFQKSGGRLAGAHFKRGIVKGRDFKRSRRPLDALERHPGVS
jgi:hypothetical protein